MAPTRLFPRVPQINHLPKTGSPGLRCGGRFEEGSWLGFGVQRTIHIATDQWPQSLPLTAVAQRGASSGHENFAMKSLGTL
jgi:hypothetical protein